MKIKFKPVVLTVALVAGGLFAQGAMATAGAGFAEDSNVSQEQLKTGLGHWLLKAKSTATSEKEGIKHLAAEDPVNVTVTKTSDGYEATIQCRSQQPTTGANMAATSKPQNFALYLANDKSIVLGSNGGSEKKLQSTDSTNYQFAASQESCDKCGFCK